MDPETAMYNQGMGNSSLPTIRSYALSVGLKL
jgi:tonB-dependent receptor, plug